MPEQPDAGMKEIKTSVIVGVGGAGKEVLMRLRRIIVENYGALSKLPVVQFLHLDTHKDLSWKGSNTVLGEDITLRGEERIELSERIYESVGSNTDAVRSDPRIQAWLYPEFKITRNFAEGAGGVRACGRLAFHYSVDAFREQLKLAALRASVQESREHVRKSLALSASPELNVHIACSLLGGTASGCFLDVCYNALDELEASAFHPIIHVYLIIGGDAMSDINKANCYGALKELEYFASSDIDESLHPFEVDYPAGTRISRRGAPFKCYLVNWWNAAGCKFKGEQVQESVARNLFFEIAPGLRMKKDEKRVDMMGTGGDRVLDRKLGRYQGFFTFGLSVLEFPAIRIRDMLADELASYSTQKWLFEKAQDVQNISGMITAMLKEQTLQEKELINYLLMVGGEDRRTTMNHELGKQMAEIDRLIDAAVFDGIAIKNLADAHIRTNVHYVTFDFDPKQCGLAVIEIQGNKRRKAEQAAQAFEQRVATMVGNSYEGPGNSLKLVNGLIDSLKVLSETMVRQLKSYEDRCRVKHDRIGERYRKFETDLSPKFKDEMKHHNRRLHDEVMKLYLSDALVREAYRFGRQLLSEDVEADGKTELCLISRLESLKSRIITYIERLRKISTELEATRADKESSVLNEPIATGLSLDRERLESVKRDILVNIDQKALKLLTGVQNELGEKDWAGNPITPLPIFKAITETFGLAERAIIALSQAECDGTRRYSIARELSRATDVGEIVRSSMDQANCLLNLSNIREDQTIDHNPKWNHWKWVATVNREVDPTVEDVLRVVRSETSMPPYQRVEVLSDAYQIVFAEEKNIFPLRSIEILSDYQKSYTRLTSGGKTIPRQTDKRIAFRDLLPAPTELADIQRRSERAHLLGRIFGFLEKAAYVETEYEAIFLTYRDSKSGQLSHTSIASDWPDVDEVLTVRQVEKSVEHVNRIEQTPLEILESLLKAIGNGAQSRSDRERVWSRLASYLSEVMKNFEGGERHPEFQRQQSIVQEFCITYRIEMRPIDRTAGIPLRPSEVVLASRSATVPLNVQQRFRQKAQQVLTNGNTLTEELRQKLLAVAKAISLPEDEALSILAELTQSEEGVQRCVNKYRELFDSLVSLGELTIADREHLKQRQAELGLTQEQVQQIEFPQTSRLYLACYSAFAAVGEVTAEDREDLRRVQAALGLTDQQVALIEEAPESSRAGA